MLNQDCFCNTDFHSLSEEECCEKSLIGSQTAGENTARYKKIKYSLNRKHFAYVLLSVMS